MIDTHAHLTPPPPPDFPLEVGMYIYNNLDIYD